MRDICVCAPKLCELHKRVETGAIQKLSEQVIGIPNESSEARNVFHASSGGWKTTSFSDKGRFRQAWVWVFAHVCRFIGAAEILVDFITRPLLASSSWRARFACIFISSKRKLADFGSGRLSMRHEQDLHLKSLMMIAIIQFALTCHLIDGGFKWKFPAQL